MEAQHDTDMSLKKDVDEVPRKAKNSFMQIGEEYEAYRKSEKGV